MAVVFKSEEMPRRALVVDDSRIARHVLSGMLDRHGFDVETVDSAEAGLNRLSESLPHVVFMDHLLPGMQGLEAVRKLRARPEAVDTRIVMYTSQDGDLFADVARAAGADDVFVKTADNTALDEILARLNLLPSAAMAPRERDNVVPLPRHGEALDRTASLEALLEPILDRHREKLRQDLLSEFAILERYEERMRLDTMYRIDAMTERAIGAISQSLEQFPVKERDSRISSGRPAFRVAAIFAAVCLGLALGSALNESGGNVPPVNGPGDAVAMYAD